jgi:hypothetical protein
MEHPHSSNIPEQAFHLIPLFSIQSVALSHIITLSHPSACRADMTTVQVHFNMFLASPFDGGESSASGTGRFNLLAIPVE